MQTQTQGQGKRKIKEASTQPKSHPSLWAARPHNSLLVNFFHNNICLGRVLLREQAEKLESVQAGVVLLVSAPVRSDSDGDFAGHCAEIIKADSHLEALDVVLAVDVVLPDSESYPGLIECSVGASFASHCQGIRIIGGSRRSLGQNRNRCVSNQGALFRIQNLCPELDFLGCGSDVERCVAWDVFDLQLGGYHVFGKENRELGFALGSDVVRRSAPTVASVVPGLKNCYGGRGAERVRMDPGEPSCSCSCGLGKSRGGEVGINDGARVRGEVVDAVNLGKVGAECLKLSFDG